MDQLKDVFASKAETLRMLVLIAVAAAMLLAFSTRFPRDVPQREMPAIAIETYFNAGWESDSLGSFVWVLQDENKIIIVNNRNVNVDVLLDLDFVGASCGNPHSVTISGGLIKKTDLLIEPNQAAQVQFQLNLKSFARVPILIVVPGEGCSPSAADGRLMKVKMWQPTIHTN